LSGISFPWRNYRSFKLARSGVCKGENGYRRGVALREGNRVFDQRDSLFGIAVCMIWTVDTNTCCLVVKLSPHRFEVPDCAACAYGELSSCGSSSSWQRPHRTSSAWCGSSASRSLRLRQPRLNQTQRRKHWQEHRSQLIRRPVELLFNTHASLNSHRTTGDGPGSPPVELHDP
jgi:hypothetical protein